MVWKIIAFVIASMVIFGLLVQIFKTGWLSFSVGAVIGLCADISLLIFMWRAVWKDGFM